MLKKSEETARIALALSARVVSHAKRSATVHVDSRSSTNVEGDKAIRKPWIGSRGGGRGGGVCVLRDWRALICDFGRWRAFCCWCGENTASRAYALHPLAGSVPRRRPVCKNCGPALSCMKRIGPLCPWMDRCGTLCCDLTHARCCTPWCHARFTLLQ